MNERCQWILCFIQLEASAPKFFGFSEFLAGLALMVLAWTLADVRYKFRIRVAPLPLRATTFWMVAIIGALTLLTDLWRAEQWYVPKGHFITPASWQGLLGGIFFLTFLAWAWFAFIRPPRFGQRNAERFAGALYSSIVRGAPEELGIVADELADSARSLISFATDRNLHGSRIYLELKTKRERAVG